MTETAGRNPPVMPPGRELDVAVAEHVMDYHVERVRPEWYRGREVLLFFQKGNPLVQYSYDENGCNAIMFRNGRDDADGVAEVLPGYSEEDNWDAMRLVVERMVALGWAVDLHMGDQSGTRSNHVSLRRWKPPWGVEASGDTVPHAVALAALKAVTSAQQGAEASRVEADRA